MRADSQAGRRSPRRRLPVPAVLAGAVALFLLVLASAADPRSSARASGGLIPGVPDPADVVDMVGGVGGNVAVGGMKAILEQLFGGIQSKLTTSVLQYLVSIPDFTRGHVAELSTRMTVMAVALVGVVATVSIIRYSAAGMLGGANDASAGLEGLMRTVGAALLILAWAPLFRALVQVANGASTAVLAGSQDDLADLFRAAVVGHFALGGAGWIISIVIALAGSMMLLALIALKVAISLTTVLLFVVMPVAIAVSPIPEMAWVGNLAMRALSTCLAIPFIWVALFATAGAVGLDTLTFSGGGGLLDRAIVKPLVGVVLLYLSVSIPKSLMKAAMMGAAPGGGMVSRAASYAAGRSLYDGVSQAWGGTTSQDGSGAGIPTGSQGSSQSYGEGQWLPPVLTGAAQASAGAGAPWASAALGVAAEAAKASPDSSESPSAERSPGSDASASNRSQDAQAGWLPPTTPGAGSGKDAETGAAAGEFQPTRFNPDRFETEYGAAQARAQSEPPSQQDTVEAIEALSPAQQAWAHAQVARHTDSPDMQARHMAHAAASDGIGPQERDAFRTLAASEGLGVHFAAATGNEAPGADSAAASPILSLPSDPDDPANSAFGLGTAGQQSAETTAAPAGHLEFLGSPPSMHSSDPTGDPPGAVDEDRNPFKD
jgi:hypothetical protein